MTINGQTHNNSKIEFSVDFDYWEGCETGEGECLPLTFERISTQDTVLLVMPCGGTVTTVFLTKEGKDTPLMSVGIDYDECPPTFDLTNLQDGKYVVYMLACGLGGSINFILLTKNK